MNRPDWKDAPDWANYLAMDSSGTWFWYEVEPSPSNGEWNIKRLSGWSIMEATSHLPDYKTTLERRP